MGSSRRQLFKSTLAGATTLGATDAFGKGKSPWENPREGYPFGGHIVGEDVAFGHKVKEVLKQDFHKKTPVTETETLILGGGISGLSAGWRLSGSSYNDFLVVEHHSSVGGKSLGGENPISAYPWGAHYLPFPSLQAPAARRLLLEMNIASQGKDKRLQYDPRQVCFAPQERLFWNSEWIYGLRPPLTHSQKAEFNRFNEIILSERQKGHIVNPVFKSKWSKETLAWDTMTAADFLQKFHLNSKEIHWFCEYATRDDFGLPLKNTSAWALLHYFIGRNAPEGEGDLVWPEGNYRVVRYLEQKLKEKIRPGRLLLRIEKKGKFYFSYTYNVEKSEIEIFKSRFISYALPKFQLPYHFKTLNPAWKQTFQHYHYSPWVVANITLKGKPISKGAGLCWDNVYYRSPSLGYVTSTHQSLDVWKQGTVLTWYRPLSEWSAKEGRTFLLKSDWKYWVKEILNDLLPSHKDLLGQILQIDVMRWGHAMAAPIPGILSHSRNTSFYHDGFSLAHSDLSAMSLFEEAQYHGVRSAEDILRRLGKTQLQNSWL